jgi:hypothetical protein
MRGETAKPWLQMRLLERGWFDLFRRVSKEQLKHDEIRLIRKGNGSALPLPLWERAGVRGYGLTIDRNPSPGSHLAMRSDLSRWER